MDRHDTQKMDSFVFILSILCIQVNAGSRPCFHVAE
jgi:hypothetical protein